MSTRTTATDAGQPAVDGPAAGVAAFVLGREPIRAELFGPDQLRLRAAEVAAASTAVDYRSGRRLLDQIDRDARILRNTHREIAAAAAGGEPIIGAAEWLLDNFHIIK